MTCKKEIETKLKNEASFFHLSRLKIDKKWASIHELHETN